MVGVKLDGDFGGFNVDRLEHSLQTATRAHRDGRDEEYVVCALLHDIGDTLGTYDHGAIAAAILKPFVSEANLWMMERSNKEAREISEKAGDIFNQVCEVAIRLQKLGGSLPRRPGHKPPAIPCCRLSFACHPAH